MNPDLFWELMGDIPVKPLSKVTKALAVFCHEYEIPNDRKIESYETFKETM